LFWGQSCTSLIEKMNKQLIDVENGQTACTFIDRENESTSCSLLNSTGEAIYCINLYGECTFANSVCIDMLGFQSEEELLGKKMHDLIHHTRNDGTPYPVEECNIFKAFQDRKGTHIDDEVLWRADGSSFDSDYRSFPLFKKGEIIGSVVSFTDISERVEAEKKERGKLDSLLRHKNAIADIIKITESILKEESIESIQDRFIKVLANALEVERVSLWYFDDKKTRMTNSSIYILSEKRFDSGKILTDKEYPNYFNALHEESVLASDDVLVDKRTCGEFKENYLKPLGINSMMDVSIRFHGKTIGVISFEHTGEIRHWDSNEQEFAILASTSLALALESSERIKSETRLRSVVNTMADALIIINEQGDIDTFNPAAEKIFGYTPEEIIGKNIVELMPESYRCQHMSGLDRYNKTGKAKILGITGVEVEGFHKDGGIIPIALSISEMFIGNKRLFSGVIRDISERKILERDTEYSRLVETANAPIFGINSEGHVNEWNQTAEEITGYSKDKVIGHDLVEEFITNEYKIPVKEILDNALRGKETANYEFPLYTKDGNRLEVLLNATTRRDVAGNITGVIGVGQDITELKKAHNEMHQTKNNIEKLLEERTNELLETELELMHSEKLETIGTLAAGIAHEVKNPMAILQLGCEYVKKKLVNDTSLTPVLNDMEDAIWRADNVIKQLLDLSASRKINLVDLDINGVISDSLLLVKHETDKAKVIIKNNCFCKTPYTPGDVNQLKQVFINIFMNSVEAMPEGGTLTVSTQLAKNLDITNQFEESLKDESYVMIKIKDTGTGVQDLDNVFKPFFTTKQSGKGTGLGLPVVQNIIKHHAGFIKCSNLADDKGFQTIILLKRSYA